MKITNLLCARLIGCALAVHIWFMHFPAWAAGDSQTTFYAGAIDVDWQGVCEKAAEQIPLGYGGLTKTISERTDGQVRFSCTDGGRSREINPYGICMIRMSLSSKQSIPIKPVLLLDTDSNVSGIRCLYDPVDTACLAPTATVPGWPKPAFKSANDERCDTYRRGPAPEPVAEEIQQRWTKEQLPGLTPKRRQWLEDLLAKEALATAELEVTTPQLLPLWVSNELFSPLGTPVVTPAVPLNRILAGQPTLAVTWWPGCETCERIIEQLHKVDPFYLHKQTAHRNHRLVILHPDAGAKVNYHNTRYMSGRFPGRSAWAVRPFPTEATPEYPYSLPQILVFDANGLLRGKTYYSAFSKEDAPGWLLLKRPDLLLNTTLGNAVWKNVPRRVSLTTLADQLRQGRLARSIADAPDVIELPQSLHEQAQKLARKGVVERREYGAQMLIDNQGPRLGTVNRGLEFSIQIKRSYADFRSLSGGMACNSCSSPTVGFGWFHTHPGRYSFEDLWFSYVDIKNTHMAANLELLAMPSGALMIALVTEDRLRAYQPVNPLLEATGARAVAIRLAQNSILGFADPRVMLWPSSFAADPHVAKWHEPLNLKKLGRFRVSYAADAAQYAASLGVALYIGSGTELHKVRWNNFDTAQQISWTGNPSAATVGREVNLTPYERLIIARLLRAYFGQENAFCDVATPSNPEAGDLMSLWDFDSDIRRLISLLPDRLSKRYPDHPPMEAAGSGYLTDADLLTLLTLIEDEVAIVEGHAVHRKNTECVMEMRSLGEYMRDTPPGVKVIETTGYDLALGRANSMYEDALGVRNLSPDENSHVRVAVDGNAVGYKCAKVALIRVSPGGKVQRLCDKTLP